MIKNFFFSKKFRETHHGQFFGYCITHISARSYLFAFAVVFYKRIRDLKKITSFAVTNTLLITQSLTS